MHCWSLGSVGQFGKGTHVTLTLEDGRTVAFKAPVLKAAPPSSLPPSPPAPAPSGW